jgi:ribonuclease E
VIGVTEALVAIDVNSGRATKEGSIEDTATKTNLEAAEEIARQLRLRDLAGLIVIDFIDMEERKNNAAVEKKLKDKLKTDRARIQVGRISGFGLMEMSRQRLRPGMLESTTQPCSHCHGTGLIRSDDSMALQVLRALEEEGTRKRSKEVLLKAPIGIVNFLINYKREHIALIEARYGMAVRLEADPTLVSPDYAIEKFKTALRVVPEPSAVISGNSSLMGAPVDEEEEDLPFEDEDEAEDEALNQGEGEAEGDGDDKAETSAEQRADGANKKKRRRRRRRKGGTANGQAGDGQNGSDEGDDGAEDAGNDADEAVADSGNVADEASGEAVVAEAATAAEAPAEKPKRSRSRGGRSKAKAEADTSAAATTESDAQTVPEAAAQPVAADETMAEAPVDAAPAKPKRAPRARKPKAVAAELPGEAATLAEAAPPSVGTAEDQPASAMPAAPVEASEPMVETAAPAPVTLTEAQAAPEPDSTPAPDAIVTADAAAPAGDAEEKTEKPRRKGWWSMRS